MFVLLVLIIILLICAIYLFKISNERHENFPPGPPRLPFYGSYWFLLFANYKYFHKALHYYAKKYNTKILGFYLGNTPSIATFNYELCKEVLSRDEFNARPDPIVVWERGFGKLTGVFFGPNWREQRWFGLRHLRDFGFGRRSFKVEDYTEGEIKYLVELFTSDPKDSDKDIYCKKGVVHMPDAIQGSLLNIILLVLTATRHDYAKLRELAKSVMKFARSVDPTGSAISITPWLRYIAPEFFGFNSASRDNKPLLDFLSNQIEEHKLTFINGYPRDFIDVYLEELEQLRGKNISNTSINEDEMLYTLLDFTFPVSVALAHSINFAFAYLIHYPDIQKKIHDEIDTVLGKARLPTLDDRKDMPYTEATIREVLRINPTNPVGLARMCTEDTTLRGYDIPKGTFIYPCVYSVHLDQELWSDPQNFRPERWIDDDGKIIKKDYSMAFGAGKRVCAGETFSRQTMFLMVSGLLQQFKFKMPKGEKPDLENLIWGINISVPNFWMEAIERTV